jgi:hypothetical protein
MFVVVPTILPGAIVAVGVALKASETSSAATNRNMLQRAHKRRGLASIVMMCKKN